MAWDELRPPGEVAGWLGITVCSGESLCKVKSLSEGHELFRSRLDYPGNKLNIVEACQPFLQVWFSRSFAFGEFLPPGAVAQLFGPEWQKSWRNILGQELQPMISTIQGAPAQLNPIFMGMWLGKGLTELEVL